MEQLNIQKTMPILLQINITANWGSTGKIADSIGIAAMDAGWESYIAYGRWMNQSQSRLVKVGGRFDKYLHFAEQRIRDNEGLCSRLATKRFIRQIEEIKPDVIQLHNIHDHYLNYQILFEYLNNTHIKVVWTFHDCWAFTGHCFHFITTDCKKWKTGCFNCPMKSVSPKTIMDRSKENYELKKSLFANCKNLTIVPVSDWMADFVKHSFFKDKKIHVIKNGVDLSIFKPSPIKNDKKIRILGVSNVWTKDKGLFDFYKLRNLLDKEKFEIILVGLSANQVKNVPEGIIGIKHTESVQELADLYSSASVFVNPTYADTFPTVNIEALACGTPVITYRTGGSPEALDEKTGIVTEQGDVNGLVSAIEDICSKDREQLRKDCRARAEQEFDKDKCFATYVELYESLINDL